MDGEASTTLKFSFSLVSITENGSTVQFKGNPHYFTGNLSKRCYLCILGYCKTLTEKQTERWTK